MYEKLKQYIFSGRYDSAKKICNSISIDDANKIIIDMALDTESISIYSFLQYMIYTTGEKKWIEIALTIMMNPLCHIEGAYNVALFLTRKLLEMDRSLENLEFMLFLHHMPERVVSEEEAISIADEVLKINPNSEIALEISKKLKK